MNRVVTRTPARLHFGLIDMNGEIGRIDGGVGLALELPYTEMEAVKAEDIQVECREDPEIVERLRGAVESVCKAYGLPGAHLDVRKRPLPHVGLGSATQLFVGAAQAICRLYGLEKSPVKLASIVGRGGTSGIGTAAIQCGGFIIDGGHAFRRGQHSKREYMPSSASAGIHPPPILVQHDFPDWDILITVPLGEGASGLREITLFKVVCPVPLEEVRQMSHILLMQMLPAVVEKDLETFARAMEDFQKLGFKVFELRAQTQLLMDCLQFLRDSGGRGVGMSSWGPALYTFGEDLTELQQKANDWLEANGGGETILTKANNVGMRFISEETDGVESAAS
jgi:beta-ribofuranosylaminobenzene 5'-phosphate synthase